MGKGQRRLDYLRVSDGPDIVHGCLLPLKLYGPPDADKDDLTIRLLACRLETHNSLRVIQLAGKIRRRSE